MEKSMFKEYQPEKRMQMLKDNCTRKEVVVKRIFAEQKEKFAGYMIIEK